MIACHNMQWSTSYNTCYHTHGTFVLSSPSYVWRRQIMFVYSPYLLPRTYSLQYTYHSLQDILKCWRQIKCFWIALRIFYHGCTWSPNGLWRPWYYQSFPFHYEQNVLSPTQSYHNLERQKHKFFLWWTRETSNMWCSSLFDGEFRRCFSRNCLLVAIAIVEFFQHMFHGLIVNACQAMSRDSQQVLYGTR